jgi:lipopolysaccharide export system protein LptA
MRRSEAARYARWSAAVALLLATVTAGVYVKRSVKAWMVKKSAPPSAPRDVTQLLSGITFSKMEGNRKVFTVQASKSTEFKDQNASLLEDVKVTIFGKEGERHDTIHTRSCQYGKGTGSILCNGDVQIELESAQDAERAAKDPSLAQIVHIETRAVKFDRASGLAQTDQPVTFTFPSGGGKAVGLEYRSEEGTLRLVREVQLTFRPSTNTREKTAGVEPGQEVQVNGMSLDFEKDSRTIQVYGPAQAATRTARLTAGQFTLALDSAFRAQLLSAIAGACPQRPELRAQSPRGEMNLGADKLTAQFAPEGWVTRLEATGNLLGSRQSADERDDFSGDSGTLDLWPRVSQPKELNLSGGVSIKSHMIATGEERVLQTAALRMTFSENQARQKGEPLSAETLAAGTLEWTDAAIPTGGTPTHTRLRADKLALQFAPDGKAKQLQAQGNVQTERAVSARPLQTATGNTGVAQLTPSGGWSQMDLQGNVKLAEGDRNAQADHALFLREGQTAALTGAAVVRDAATETQAPRITFVSATGDIRAEGGVRSTDLSPRGSAVQLAPVPANITADNLQANSKTGRALYTGHARLWQGDSVLEANSIELFRDARILNAAGKVRAVFPQAPAQPPAGASALPSTPKRPNLWHIAAETLTFNDPESHAHLEKNVIAQSADQRFRAPIMDLYFSRGAQPAAGPSGGNTTNTGPQQISRAVGTGGVIVDQGSRRATAEHGEYTAADGKFVMSGGNPTIYDPSEGTTTGLQLTFFLADDSIIVDSGKGSRTLTKHRVEKRP